VGKEVWFFTATVDVGEVRFCYDLRRMPFNIFNMETLKWRQHEIDLTASEQFTTPIVFLYSKSNIPVIDGRKLFFLNANPPFYIDIVENLAYPIPLQPKHRSNLSLNFVDY